MEMSIGLWLTGLGIFIGLEVQQANLTINVAGKDVCSYCRGDIAAAAQVSGGKSVTINAFDDKTGLAKTYIWEPGMKTIKEMNKK